MATIQDTFGEQLRKAREYRNLSQYDLARMIESQQPQIARYESTARLPSLPVLVKIAEVLNMPVEYFFGIDDPQ